VNERRPGSESSNALPRRFGPTTPAGLFHPVLSRRHCRSRPTPSRTTSRSASRRRRMRPKRYESQSPRWSAPTLKSPCGRAGTRIRSSASVPTTRPWRPGHCCAGASPRVTLRESSSRRPVRSRRSSRPKAIVAPLPVRRGGELDRDEFIASLARFGYRRESLVEHRAEFAVRGASSTSGRRRDTSRFVSTSSVTRSSDSTSFDIANQRSLHDLDEGSDRPAREWLLSHDARQGAERMIDAMAWAARRSTDSRRVSSSTAWRAGCPSSWMSSGRCSMKSTTPPWSWSNRIACRADWPTSSTKSAKLTDAVAATWQATSQIPLLHADWSRVLEGRIDVALDASLAGTTVRSISRRRRSSRATLRASPRTFVGGRRNVEGWCSRRTPRPSSAWPTNCAAKGWRSRPTPPGCSTCASACSRARWRRASASMTGDRRVERE